MRRATILVMTPKVVGDHNGVLARKNSEMRQGVRPDGEYKDLGLVVHEGIEVYAALYRPPAVIDDSANL